MVDDLSEKVKSVNKDLKDMKEKGKAKLDDIYN